MLIQEGNESDAMNPDISKLKKGKYILKLLESTFLIVLSFLLHVISQLFSCCPLCYRMVTRSTHTSKVPVHVNGRSVHLPTIL